MTPDIPPTPTNIDEVQKTLESIREEHVKLVEEINAAKQWLNQQEVQKKQLNDFSDHLGKEQKRLQDWESSLKGYESKFNDSLASLSGTLQAHLQHLNTNKIVSPEPAVKYKLVKEHGITADTGYLGVSGGNV